MSLPPPRALQERFGANVKRARMAAGLSQAEVGIRASLHRTEIGLLERGERLPRIDTAIRIASALGVPFAELVDGIEWEPGRVGRGGFSAPEPRP